MRAKPRPRPRVTAGVTVKLKVVCGSIYVTINEDGKGLAEVFVKLGRSGGCGASQTEAMGRLISLALRAGIAPEEIIKQLKNIRCPYTSWDDGVALTSCADAVAKALEAYLKGEYKKPGLTDAAETSKKLEEFSGEEVETEQTERTEQIEQIGQIGQTKTVVTMHDGGVGLCPDCGSQVVYLEGCALCPNCGYSKCG